MSRRHHTPRLLVGLFVVTGLILAAGGCSKYTYDPFGPPPAPSRYQTQDADLVGESYAAADAMLNETPWLRDQRAPIIVATFVNINSLQNSSGLGRIIAEQIAARFAQAGFTVIELKLRNDIFVKENAGEFVLSRNVKDIARAHNATAVVAGSYAAGRNNVFVNARMIRAADSLILAAYDYKLPIGPDTTALLASQ